jgi:putative transposase
MGSQSVKDRKRHLLVDTLGLPIAWYVTAADVSDPHQGARKLLGDLAFFVPRLKKIWADAAYRGKELAEWCREGQQNSGRELEIVERTPGARGFTAQPRRLVVERSFAWLVRNRRLAKPPSWRTCTFLMMHLLLRY